MQYDEVKKMKASFFSFLGGLFLKHPLILPGEQ